VGRHSVNVLLRVYTKCIVGRDKIGEAARAGGRGGCARTGSAVVTPSDGDLVLARPAARLK
jgi:hypothetical protein